MTDPQPRSKRGTRRVLLSMPLMFTILGDESGLQFKAETINVNREGARIRTRQPLQAGQWLCVTAAEPQRSVEARVVWGKAEMGEYGIQLQHPGNFWGVYFPPDDWQEPVPIPGYLTGAGRQPPAAPKPAPALPTIPAEGTKAVVTGMSAVRMPFQESGQLMPCGKDEGTILVKPSIAPGTSLRVIINEQVFMARIRAVSSHREQGRWRLWLRFG